jgi:hypothetical protein
MGAMAGNIILAVLLTFTCQLIAVFVKHLLDIRLRKRFTNIMYIDRRYEIKKKDSVE